MADQMRVLSSSLFAAAFFLLIFLFFDELLHLPIVGIAFENTAEAPENGLLYIDVNQIIDNPATPTINSFFDLS